MTKPKLYPYIRAWGQLMGSNGSYVDDQVSRARETKAPDDAYSWDQNNNKWSTIAEIKARADAGNPTAADTLERVEQIVILMQDGAT